MSKYKTPKTDGASKIKKAYQELRKRKPSKALLEILKKKPTDNVEQPIKKIAKDHLPDAEA
jgi:hypothetical protein